MFFQKYFNSSSGLVDTYRNQSNIIFIGYYTTYQACAFRMNIDQKYETKIEKRGKKEGCCTTPNPALHTSTKHSNTFIGFSPFITGEKNILSLC